MYTYFNLYFWAQIEPSSTIAWLDYHKHKYGKIRVVFHPFHPIVQNQSYSFKAMSFFL